MVNILSIFDYLWQCLSNICQYSSMYGTAYGTTELLEVLLSEQHAICNKLIPADISYFVFVCLWGFTGSRQFALRGLDLCPFVATEPTSKCVVCTLLGLPTSSFKACVKSCHTDVPRRHLDVYGHIRMHDLSIYMWMRMDV